MLARMFEQDKSADAKRIAEKIAENPEGDWSNFLYSVSEKGKPGVLQEAIGYLFELREMAYDNINSSAECLFKLLQLNMLAESSNKKPGFKENEYNQLCMNIAEAISNYDNQNSLADRVGGAQLKIADKCYELLVSGYDYNRSAISRITAAISIIDAHLAMHDVEIHVEPRIK